MLLIYLEFKSNGGYMKSLRYVLLLILLSHNIFGQNSYVVLRNDTLFVKMNNNKVLYYYSEHFKDHKVFEATYSTDNIYVHIVNSNSISKIIKISINKSIIQVIADNINLLGNLLWKNNNYIYVYKANKILTKYDLNDSCNININCDKQFSVSPDNKRIIFSNYDDYENMFCYELEKNIIDTIYCYKYSNNNKDIDGNNRWVGVTSSISWLKPTKICYGSGENGLIIMELKNNKFVNYLIKHNVKYNVSILGPNILSIVKTDSLNKYDIYKVDTKYKKEEKILSGIEFVYDIKWIKKNIFTYICFYNDKYYVYECNTKTNKIKTIYKTFNNKESICILK